MSGKILQVNISRGGVPKRAVFVGKLTRSGLEGDSFAHPAIHGGPSQAVLLIANEVIQELAALGYPVFPGALGENLTTTGLPVNAWRSGQQYHVGSARIELTSPREPCSALNRYGSSLCKTPIQKQIYDSGVKRGDPTADHWGKSGFYARVLQEGEIAADDTITLESGLV